MNTKKLFLIIFVAYTLVYSLHTAFLKKTVYGDGIFYYAWVHTIGVDRDLDFRNEYGYYGISQPPTVTHRLRNIYSIGPALLWLPGYILVHNLVRGTGFEFKYEFVTGLQSVFLTVVGLLLLHRMLTARFTKETADYVAFTVAFATNLLYYGAIDPVNSHAPTFIAAVLFTASLMHPEKISSFFSGLFYGLLGTIRMQDLIYGLLLVKNVRFLSVTILAVGFITILLPQLVIWKLFGGSFVQSPYFGEKLIFFRPLNPAFVQVLFSPLNGLLLWTPVLIPAIFGLVSGGISNKPYSRTALIIISLQLYIVSIRNEWWQEASYSGRMFVSVLPLFAIGLAYFINTLKNHGYRPDTIGKLIVLFSLLNGCLIIFYLLIHW